MKALKGINGKYKHFYCATAICNPEISMAYVSVVYKRINNAIRSSIQSVKKSRQVRVIATLDRVLSLLIRTVAKLN